LVINLDVYRVEISIKHFEAFCTGTGTVLDQHMFTMHTNIQKGA